MTILKISGLPASFTPDRVRRLFEPFGVVRSIDRDGRHFYIEMETRESAEEAKKLLEGLVFDHAPVHLVLSGGAISAVA